MSCNYLENIFEDGAFHESTAASAIQILEIKPPTRRSWWAVLERSLLERGR